MIDDKDRWRRGAEYLRIAAHGLPVQAAGLYMQIAKAHEKNNDGEGMWAHYHKAMTAGRAAKVATLPEEDRKQLAVVVKQLGERAMKADEIDAALEAFKFLFQRKGLGAQNMLESGAFLRSRPDLDRPDLQVHTVLAIMQDHGKVAVQKDGFTFHVCQLRPESRGRGGLRSADPLADQTIADILGEWPEGDVAVDAPQWARIETVNRLFGQWTSPEVVRKMPGQAPRLRRRDFLGALPADGSAAP